MRQRARRAMGRTVIGFGLASSLALIALPTCGGDDPGDDGDPGDFDRQALLESLGTYVILPTYREFVSAAQDLEEAAGAWSAAVASSSADTAERLEAAREAWRAAMAIWQQAELMQVGPAGSSAEVMGGQDLRDEIYSWPTVSSCRVDQEVVEQQYTSPTFFQDELVNVYGLDALEYLLFNDSVDNSCPSQATINSEGTWDALGEEAIWRQRAEYAHATAGYLVEVAQLLVSAWEPDQGNFLGELATAGDSGSIYPSAQSALDEVFAAMYYLELDTKDMKLAEPAGISDSCTSTTCPEELESPWARSSKENIAANLRGFQKLLMGDDPVEADRVGFDDYLVALGAGELATTMADDTIRAIQAVEAIPGTMDEALVNDLSSVEAAYTAVKTVTDNLKSQFVTVLNLKVPEEGAGDND